MPAFNWKNEGFAAPPVPTVATGQEKLYRAWGGGSTKLGNPTGAGVCFSLDRAKSRWDAEGLYSVMEWNNAVMNITEFSIPKGTPFWLGQVDPGDQRAVLGKYSGNQVFIERGYVKDLLEQSTVRLSDDLGDKIFIQNRSNTTH